MKTPGGPSIKKRLGTGIVLMLALSSYSKTHSQQPASHGQKITIPEGTPVKVHIYGVDTVNCNAKINPAEAQNLQTHTWVIQADEAVTVNGAVVVPAGSLGLLHVAGSYDKKSLGFHVATAHITTAHYCIIQLVSIFGIDESNLQLDTEKINLAPPITDDYTAKNGGVPSTLDVQLTGRLKQATVTLP